MSNSREIYERMSRTQILSSDNSDALSMKINAFLAAIAKFESVCDKHEIKFSHSASFAPNYVQVGGEVREVFQQVNSFAVLIPYTTVATTEEIDQAYKENLDKLDL